MSYNTFGRYRYTMKDSTRRALDAKRNTKVSLVSSSIPNDKLHPALQEKIMTTRILDAAAQTLENARMYLAKLPIEDQYFAVDRCTNQLYNPAIPVLFAAEYYVRRDAAHDD